MNRGVTRRAVLIGGTAAVALANSSATAAAWTADDGGRRLFQGVAAYAASGNQRTGTDGARATKAWLRTRLRVLGARPRDHHYDYERYDWSARVTIDGRRVATIPYFYEGTGEIDTTEPFFRSVSVVNGIGAAQVTAALAEAEAAGAPLAVLATTNQTTSSGPYPGLVGINSAPDRPGTGIPTLLIAGAAAAAAETGRLRAAIRARRVTDREENIIAWFGPPVPDPIIVTTPLTGWFACAAERGPGVVYALDLAARLRADGRSVLFIATTGHEIGGLGLIAYLQSDIQARLNPTKLIHLGASLAAGVRDSAGKLTLGPDRRAVGRPAIPGTPIATALAAASFAPTTEVSPASEAHKWAQHLPASTPFLSVTGTFPQFHTPDDIPTATTSPHLLATAKAAIDSAVDLFLS